MYGTLFSRSVEDRRTCLKIGGFGPCLYERVSFGALLVRDRLVTYALPTSRFRSGAR